MDVFEFMCGVLFLFLTVLGVVLVLLAAVYGLPISYWEYGFGCIVAGMIIDSMYLAIANW